MVSLGNFLKTIVRHRSTIRALTLREMQSRYVGSVAGVLWSVFHPLMTILVYWFVFSVGFRVAPAGGVPYIVVFLCGFLPWSLFAESVTAGTASIRSHTDLVTKTVFPAEILPVVPLMVGLITHTVMLLLFLAVLFFSDISLSVYSFQSLYYLFALSVFSLGLGWLLSAINVFYKDVEQTLNVALNLWFWLTPVVWLPEMIPAKYHFFLKINPLYYIAEGYKSSFLYPIPFWHRPLECIQFWAMTVTVFLLGALIFQRLRPEFAEAL